MNPRAQALARILISRLGKFERARQDEDAQDERETDEQRMRLVEKVLFTEVGLTDYAKARLVAVATPRLRADGETADREQRELAAFLDAHLDWAALSQ